MIIKCEYCNSEREIKEDIIMFTCKCGHINDIFKEVEGGEKNEK